jgi:hypothetical protein
MSDTNDMNKEMFAHLVILLASSTMQHLGKVLNPATNTAEVNLEAAQSSIDLLDMLEAKTHGNLDKDEDRFLKSTLAQLKMNFVETANTQPAEAGKPEVEPAAGDSKPAPGTAPEAGKSTQADKPTQAGKPAGEDEKKKFHKTYG